LWEPLQQLAESAEFPSRLAAQEVSHPAKSPAELVMETRRGLDQYREIGQAGKDGRKGKEHERKRNKRTNGRAVRVDVSRAGGLIAASSIGDCGEEK
jgi:hypothetical protein